MFSSNGTYSASESIVSSVSSSVVSVDSVTESKEAKNYNFNIINYSLITNKIISLNLIKNIFIMKDIIE